MPDLHQNLALYKQLWSTTMQELRDDVSNRPILRTLFQAESGQAGGEGYFLPAIGVREDAQAVATARRRKTKNVPTMSTLNDLATNDQTLAELRKRITGDTKVKKQATYSEPENIYSEKWFAPTDKVLEALDSKSETMKFMKTEMMIQEDDVCLDALDGVVTRKVSGTGAVTADIAVPSTSLLNVAIGEGNFTRNVFTRNRAKFRNRVKKGEIITMLISWDDWATLCETETQILGSRDYADPEDRFMKTGELPIIFGHRLYVHDRVAVGTYHSWVPSAFRFINYGCGYETFDIDPAFRNQYIAQMSDNIDVKRVDDNGYVKGTIIDPVTPPPP